MRSGKKMICLLLALVIGVGCLSVQAWAEETETEPQIPTGGTCGEALSWTLDEAGVLTVSGTGAMEDYPSYTDVPWYASRASITAVVIESGVTTIGESAFSGCEALVTVTLPEGLTQIGDDAFYDCTVLSDILLPEGVTRIGVYAFAWCVGLTELALPQGLTTIGDRAFTQCEALTAITIPGTVTEIGIGAFSNCAALTGIFVEESNEYFSSDEMGVLFDKEKTLLIAAPGAIPESYAVPEGTTAIGDSAFSGCALLTGVQICEGVTRIGTSAFAGCTALKEALLPQSLTDMGDYAFSQCKGLTGITIPEGVTQLGRWMFDCCFSLKTVSLPQSVTAIGDFAFYECTSLKDIVLPAGLTTIGSHAFYCCKSLKTIDLPEGLTILADWAFAECYALTGIQIPGSVTSVGGYAFQYDTAMTEIRFAGSAPTIGESAFGSVTATAWYPSGDLSWTVDVCQDYGGTITWEPYGDAVITLDAPTIEYCFSRLSTSVRVAWTAVEGAGGYELWRSTTPEEPDSWELTKTIRDGAVTSYTNQGLTEGVTYYYAVRAFVDAADGTRIWSEFSNMDYMPAAVVFDDPYSNSTFRIRLRWGQIGGAHGYQIWRQDADGTFVVAKTIGDRGNELTDDQGATTAYSNVGLTAGADYTYKMRAFYITEDGRKIFGAFSQEITVAVMPETPQITVTAPKAGRAQLSWEALEGAEGYQVWMSTSAEEGFAIGKSVTDGASAGATVYGLESGTTYYFKVRAYVEVEGKKTFGGYSETVEICVP